MPEDIQDSALFFILHGDDEFSREQELGRLRARLAAGDPAMADLNTMGFDGGRVTFGELRHACDVIPFLAQRRLVIVHGLLTRLSSGGKGSAAAPEADSAAKRSFRDELAAYLPALPPTTRLILVEPEPLPAGHPILQVAETEQKKKRAHTRLFSLPKDRDLPGWIAQRAAAAGGRFNRDAAEMLAALVGPDLRLLDAEIEKLLLYVDGERPVSSDDVRQLISRAREASIFDLVDCVGRKQTNRALQLLHRLLEDGAEPLGILSMLGRQVRILIEVGELSAQGLAQHEMAARLKLHPFVVSKALDQIKNFEVAQLEAAHRRVVETDWAIKTGRLDDTLALDLLVAGLGDSAAL